MLHCVCFCIFSILSTKSEEHFTFTLTNLEGQFRFGFCRYPPKGDVCMCILRYYNFMYIIPVRDNFIISSDLPWFKVFYRVMDKVSDMQKDFQVRMTTSERTCTISFLVS